jgi:hypothetical protein
MQSSYARLSLYELRVVAMLVARPFKSIQLFLFNSLRAVLGMGNENGLACYGFDKSGLLCRENQKTSTRVRVRVRVVRVRG